MAELVTTAAGATVDGVLRLTADGFTAVEGYQVSVARTGGGLRYDVLTPAGDQVSWTARVGHAKRTLILGGARSGKSTEAERLLAGTPDTLYVATGGDGSTDPEWADRIAKHRARRPASWGLAETIDLVPLLESDGPPLLIDCLTLWLARTMDSCDIWDHQENLGQVEHRIDALAAAWSTTPGLL